MKLQHHRSGPVVVAAAIVFALTAGVGDAPSDAQTATQTPGKAAVAIFAGGCFWCMEPPFDKLAGVKATTSGYTGGHVDKPTYEQVSAGRTGHAEAVRVEYDPARVSYSTLLEVFWRNVDPLAVKRQFCDAGDQYRSAIFPIGAEQQRFAEASKRKVQERFKEPIATQIVAATTFYPAESYHQNYYLNNPIRYKFYRFNCGRDQRLEQLWGAAGKQLIWPALACSIRWAPCRSA